MQTITIEAATPQSARALYRALDGFRAELRESDDGRRFVDVELGGSDGEIADVLNALEDYVVHRHEGPARIELNGRKYTLHAVN